MIVWYVCLMHLSLALSLTGGLESDMTPAKATKTWGTIFPGTKWCGKGNKATHEFDFGTSIETDKCCRNHDRCPDKIKRGMTKYGLQNDGSTTLLSCQCDETFYDCLKGARTTASKTVGVMYFDLLNRKCFIESPQGSGRYKWIRPRRFSRVVKFFNKYFH